MKKIVFSFFVAVFMSISAFAQWENSAIQLGSKAPELAYQSPDGNTISLAEINKGRYILLDFWASWCGPCRASNPGLVRLYNEYSHKKFKNAKSGFTVVSFSLDVRKESWIAAIQRDNLTWPYHMSDLNPQQWHSVVCSLYGIQSIPQAMLIGPDGRILGMYMRGEEAIPDLNRYVVE